jgi:putative ABC transport system permease protein
MGALRRLLLRLRNAIVPARAESELQRELQSHLGVLEDEYRHRGLDDDSARRAARAALGPAATADWQRDTRSIVWIDDLRRDTRYALRSLRRAPGFALAAILTLALSIGATVAIFTVVDHILVRPLPAPHADRLVRLYSSNASSRIPKDDVSAPVAADWRRTATSFDLISGSSGTSVTLTGAADTDALIGMLVDAAFFDVTGAKLTVGTPFAASAYQASSNAQLGALAARVEASEPASVIVSDAVWHRQFGGDPGVIGRHVRLNDIDAVVVGVMPAGFRFASTAWGEADCWLPRVDAPLATRRRLRVLSVVARLKPGVTMAHAQEEMTRISVSLGEVNADDRGWTSLVEPLKDSLTGDVRPTLLLLAGGAACVLLVACASIAGLLLVRSAGRTREVAVRLALGASRWRLIRQWLTESTVLALLGGMCGLVLAVWAVPAVMAYAPATLPRTAEVTIDVRVVFFALFVSVVVGQLCGMFPALALGRMTSGVVRTHTVTASTRSRRMRAVLAVGQIGIAVLLLVLSGLFARSVIALKTLDLGFRPQGVLTFGVNLRSARYSHIDTVKGLSRDLMAALQGLPGVTSVSNGLVPLLGSAGAQFDIEGRDGAQSANVDVVSPDGYQVLGLRLCAGRFFTNDDQALSEPVAVVSRSFALAVWHTDQAVDRRIRVSGRGSTTWTRVVGVINDVRRKSLEETPPPLVLLSAGQPSMMSSTNFSVRTAGDPSALVPAIRALIARLDSTVPVTRLALLTSRVDKLIAPRQFNLWLIGGFALVAFVLAVVGVAGLVGELVTRRTNEIGIRRALGASSRHVIVLVVGGAAAVAATGIGLGMACATFLSRVLGALIFGVTPLDRLTFVTAPVLMLVAALLAAIPPVRRALRVDPVVALRHE